MKPEDTIVETPTIQEKTIEEVTPVPAPKAAPTVTASNPNQRIWATGRRKTAVAQVRMVFKKNGGKVIINRKSPDEHFKGNKWQAAVALQSFLLVKHNNDFDFVVKVNGGGITGQAEAVRHGIARALIKWDPKLKPQLRKIGYLTRDPRMVERKKPGQPKARKRFQYSKR